MATTLGSLVVRLGLDAAEFVTGLTASERQARQFAKRIDEGIKGATVAFGVMTAAAGAALVAVDQLAKQAGEFQDLAEMTGASAEGLASFAVAAGVAGVEMSTIADASVKLTKGMVDVDDETKAAGAALAALGLSVKDFKALAPEEQIDQVAKALAGFEDGAAKTAVAVALFGKSGAQLLPFLKELAAEGGRQIILTDQQIKLADEYADKQARVVAELKLYAQVAATQMLPAFTVLTEAAGDFIKALIGVDGSIKDLANSNAIADFANNAARAFAFIADSADGISRLFLIAGNNIGASAAMIGALADGDIKRYNAINQDAAATIDKIIMRQTARFTLEKRIAEQATNAALRAREDRGFTPATGRKLNFSGAADKPQADKTSEAQRYLESLQKQIDKTLELTTVQQAQQDLFGGKLKGLTPEIQRQILATAALIDEYKDLDKWLRESGKAFDEQVKKQRELNDEQAKATNSALDRAKSAQDNNERLRDEIAITLGGVEAQKALAKAYADSAVAEAEKDRIVRASRGAKQDELEAIDLTIEALKEYRDLLDGKDIAEQLVKDAKALQDVSNMFADDFADAFTDIANGSKTAKDAFIDLGNTILQQINRIAAQNLANAIFGGNNSAGPDIFGVLGKLVGAYFGASSGGVPGVGFSGGGFGEHFAAGGVSSGGWATVGENGPELVNLPKGARVHSNSDSRSMLGGQNITVNLTTHVQGAVSRATEYQIAQSAGRAVSRAQRR